MPNTYVALATQTLGTAATSVTFSSIPTGYTDLFLVATTVGASLDALVLQFNADTSTNYSTTILYGTGSAAASARETNSTYVYTGLSGSAMSQSTYNIMNYANTTTFKTTIGRGDAANGQVRAGVSLWRSTSAINSIRVFRTANNNMDAGSTFSLYGIANADQGSAKATGGIITEDSQYWYHTFAASGTFTPKQALTCDYLVLAGGASGGAGAGGGGGAGGMRCTVTGTGGSGSLESPISVTSGTPYTITVGAGGAATPVNTVGNNGSNSVFSTITATGGGAGGTYFTTQAGTAGGSGGGGQGAVTVSAGGAASPSGQGFAGGAGSGAAGGAAGGGGGASAVGVAGVGDNAGGAGGAGRATVISGFSVTYAGGGGGAAAGTAGGTGGAGGGGTGGYGPTNPLASGAAATINTGGGGGGGWQGSVGTGGAGGSGIVIVRYAK